MKIAGLDIGTTGCKLTVFDEHGSYLEKAYRTYPVSRAKKEHEVDPAAIWTGVLQVIKEMAQRYPDISGIGVTSFGETFVMTDEEGTPLRHSMLYTDPRGTEECSELEKRLGGDLIGKISGLKPHPMYSISKIMWVKKHDPLQYARAKHLFLIQDYIVFLLTGVCQIDYSLASRTMAFDIRKLDWSPEILDAVGIDSSLLSRPVPTGTSAGTVRPEISRETGLAESTIIVSISHDQVAAAIGSGVLEPGKAVDGAGTVECITPVFDGIPENPVLFEGSYSVVPYIIPGKYVCYAFSYTGGALVQWCVDTLAKEEKKLAVQAGVSVNQMLEQQTADEPTGLLVLPHFAGAATPYMDIGSRGAILGLTLAHTVSDIYRACMEGVAFEMKVNLERLEQAGIRFSSLQATGGGANSQVWMQMKADILGMPITALKASDAGTVGSAMLTGIAVGIFRDLNHATEEMVKEKQTYFPRKQQQEQYEAVYQRYRKVYNAVRPLFDE
ncbi:MAG: FGGY-family carbohydrate kinase [Massiliimalia sp.]